MAGEHTRHGSIDATDAEAGHAGALASIVDLESRPAREPDHALEAQTLVDLAQALATSPSTILQRSAECALLACRAGSCGIDLLFDDDDDRQILRWHAAAGFLAAQRWRTMARSNSPWGIALDRGTTTLFTAPIDHLDSVAKLTPDVTELLVAPITIGKQSLGTLWVAAHDDRHAFDREDGRLLESLATFVAGVCRAMRGGSSTRTELKETTVALSEAEVRFVKFMQHLPGLAWIKDLEGRYVFANDAALRAFRRPRGALYGRTDADLFPTETARAFRENDLAALASPHGLEAIETLVQEDGEHHSLVSKFAIPSLDGTPSLIGGVAIDLTEHLRIEVALRESEARFRSMADNAPVLIWMNGLEGCEFVNREYLRFVGRPFDEVTGMEWRTFIHPDDAEEYLATYLRALGRQEPFEAQFRFRRADGEYRWMHSTGVPRLTLDGTMVGYVGCSVDITDIKRSEEALREADRRKDEFLATLAHELRNPLAPIRNSLHILRVAPNAEGSDRIHDILDRQVAQMVRLVDDLLEVSRITRGKIELRRERVSLGDALRSALETSRPLIEAARHQLTVSMPNDSLFVEADAVRLAQVFANLLNNAAKYTEEGGHIQVLVERGERDVRVSVRDDGIGIPPDMLPKVFDLFTQIDRTLGRAQGGLGIGLALVKRLVEMHDGRVEVHSTPGDRGSEFLVVLPLAREQTRPEVSRRTTPSLGTLPVMRVLVVDDNRDSADSLAIFLRHLGLEVSVAHDGFAALERAEAWLPSVVLLDLGMPRMDGYEVARRLRRDPAHASTLLIALTGWGQPEDRRRSAEAGFDHHLVKPVEFGVLRTLLGTLPRPDADA